MFKTRAVRQRAVVKGVALSVGLSLLAGACGTDTPDGSAQQNPDETTETTEALGDPVLGGTLTVGLEGETNSFLPGEGQFTNPGLNVTAAIFDPLVSAGEDGELHPYLAESYAPNDDLTEWTLELRPDVTFHDGEVFDAEVLKAIFDEYLRRPGSIMAGTLAEVIELRVDGPLTATYVLGAPNAAFAEVLAGPAGWPFSVVAARAAGPDAGSKPMGTGPFKMESWDRDDKLVVKKNESYWRQGLPYLDEVVFRSIPDESSRVATLQAGGIDAMQTLNGVSMKEIMAVEDEGFDAHIAIGDDTGASIMNTQRPPFDDLRVRKAWQMAANWEDVARISSFDGIVGESTQYYGPDSKWHSEKVAAAAPPYDIEAAKKLLADYVNDPERSDGKPVGAKPEITYQCLPDPTQLEISQLLLQEATAIGFEVKLENMEQATLVEKVVGNPAGAPPFRGDYSVSCIRLTAYGDPYTTFLGAFGHPDDQILNLSDYTSPEIVELTAELKTTADYAERFAIVEKIGLELLEAAPVVFSVETPAMIGSHERVKNVEGWTNPDGGLGNGLMFGWTRWGEVWLEEGPAE